MRNAGHKRERGDTTRFGLPPLPEPYTQRFPVEPPWDTPIAEMAGWSLDLSCCKGTTQLPLRLLAGGHGWNATLRDVLPKLKCRECGRLPSQVILMADMAVERKRPENRGKWMLLA